MKTLPACLAIAVGRSIVMHRDADDFRARPTGSSGARVACGVIRKA